MEENKNEIYEAADVVLLIVENEGEIEHILEYPSEFQPAYEVLLQHKVIRDRDGAYVPGEHFEKALRLGFSEFLERKKAAEKRAATRNKWAIGIASGTLLAAAGYFFRPHKRA